MSQYIIDRKYGIELRVRVDDVGTPNESAPSRVSGNRVFVGDVESDIVQAILDHDHDAYLDHDHSAAAAYDAARKIGRKIMRELNRRDGIDLGDSTDDS